jgi:hypothetical protein
MQAGGEKVTLDGICSETWNDTASMNDNSRGCGGMLPWPMLRCRLALEPKTYITMPRVQYAIKDTILGIPTAIPTTFSSAYYGWHVWHNLPGELFKELPDKSSFRRTYLVVHCLSIVTQFGIRMNRNLRSVQLQDFRISWLSLLCSNSSTNDASLHKVRRR